jgi:DNA-binding NtrC family response regulator
VLAAAPEVRSAGRTPLAKPACLDYPAAMTPEEEELGETLPIADESRVIKLKSKRIRAEVVSGPDAGAVARLAGPEVRIGSGADCDLVLTDPTVSRQHLVLRVEGDDIRVLDAGSRNGSTLDGVRVRDAYARPDSLIAIGSTTLRLRMLTDVVELPLSPRERFGQMIGRSVAIRRVFALLERIAGVDTTLLVEGETGTGKELVARGIHEASARAKKPFVVFDCSAISSNLIESELFGHTRGSFTGAVTAREGALEAADGGTLFLDELGELPIDVQPKLLRALETREVRRVGATQVRKVDVRLIAATNRSLAREVDRGRFREDLYYRLAVVTVRLPPLRERLEDIPLLVRHFEQDWASRPDAPPPLPESLVSAFAAQSWPGNIRELRNAVNRALLFGAPQMMDEPASSRRSLPLPDPLTVELSEPLMIGRERVAARYEKAYLELILGETNGNVSHAAKRAGVGRRFVQQAMKRHGLRGAEPAGDADDD